MKIFKLLQLDALPQSTGVGLLVLRLWLGLSMFLLHGWSKVTGFPQLSSTFPDPLGVGSYLSLTLAVFSEVICCILLVLGLFTRAAALVLAVTMATAFLLVHKGVLSAPGSELSFIYLAGFVVLLVAGGGRFSLDTKLNASPSLVR